MKDTWGRGPVNLGREPPCDLKAAVFVVLVLGYDEGGLVLDRRVAMAWRPSPWLA